MDLLVKVNLFIVAFSLIWKILYFFTPINSLWIRKGLKKSTILKHLSHIAFQSLKDFSIWWHDFKLLNPEKLFSITERRDESCLLVGYHSRCTVDLLYLYTHLQPSFIISYLFFTIPFIPSILYALNFYPSKKLSEGPEAADSTFIKCLTGEGIVSPGDPIPPLMLIPGGVFECLKSYEERYKVLWNAKPGFARVISSHPTLQKKVSVVPFYIHRGEETFYSSKSWYNWTGKLSRDYYKSFKNGNLLVLPLMLTIMMMSIGFVFLPSSTRLRVHFADPIRFIEGESTEEFAARIKCSLQNLIDKANDSATVKEDYNEERQYKLGIVSFLFLGIFTTIQNIFFMLLSFILIWSLFLPILIITICQSILKLFRITSKKKKKI